MSWLLCSKADVISIHPIAEAALPDLWSDAIEQMIREHLGQPGLGLAQVTYTESYSGDNSPVLVPLQLPIIVTPPKPEEREIVPFTLIKVGAMLAVVGRDDKGEVLEKPMRNSADRNRALLLLLLDTGMRASELCSLPGSGVDNHNRRVRVMGKGSI